MLLRAILSLGWGATSDDAQNTNAQYLQQARMKVEWSATCINGPWKSTIITDKESQRVTDKMFCAQDIDNRFHSSSCGGDSGGPFVCMDKNTKRWTLHGVLSWATKT